MGVAVNLNVVTVCNLAFLSLVCAAAYFGLRRKPALAWMAAALMCGCVELMFLSFAKNVTVGWLAAVTLVPSAYLCIGQAVRIVTGTGRQHWWLVASVAGLSATSLLLPAAGVPFVFQAMPFQLACGLALADSVFRLARQRKRSVVDTCLIVSISGTAAVFLIRIPLFPFLFDSTASYATVTTSTAVFVLMTIAMLLTPPTIFLLLARIVGSEIATYRTRSERDGLTGLLNRQAFDHAAEAQMRVGGGAIVLCDIDRFKQVNDRYGHQAGDAVLRAFASLLSGTGCLAGRLGGDEFVLHVPGRTACEAADLADTIRLRFASVRQASMAANHGPSASFGVAGYGAGATRGSVFGQADAALYRAKKEGRNRVMMSGLDDRAEKASAGTRQAA